MQNFFNNKDIWTDRSTMQQKKSEIICEICFEEHTKVSPVPRVLSCGHCYCTNCIRQLMNRSRKCPKCSKTMPNQKVENFPINFSLLSVIEDREPDVREALKKFHKKILSIQEQMQATKTQAESILSLTSSKLSAIEQCLKNDNKDLNEEEIFKWITEVNREIKSFEAACSFNCKELSESATFNISQADHTPDIVDLYNEVKKTPEFYVSTKIKEKVTHARLTTSGSRLVLHAFDAHCVDDVNGIKTILLDDLKILMKNTVVNGFIEFECNRRKVTRKIVITPFATIYGCSFLKICTGENGSSLRGSPVSKISNQITNGRMKLMFTIVQDAFMQENNSYFFNSEGGIKFKDYLGKNVIGWCQSTEDKTGLSVCHINKDSVNHYNGKVLNNDDEINFRNQYLTLKNFVGTCVNEGDAPSLSDIQLPNEDLLVVNCGISFNVL